MATFDPTPQRTAQIVMIALRPHVKHELAATRGAMAALRVAVRRHTPQARRAKSEKHAQAARRLLALDSAYAAVTGVTLRAPSGTQNYPNLPQYAGPLYEWRIGPAAVAVRTIQACERLRTGKVMGVHPHTAHIGLHYFASIWPDPAPWPEGIDRPFTPDQEDV